MSEIQGSLTDPVKSLELQKKAQELAAKMEKLSDAEKQAIALEMAKLYQSGGGDD